MLSGGMPGPSDDLHKKCKFATARRNTSLVTKATKRGCCSTGAVLDVKEMELSCQTVLANEAI